METKSISKNNNNWREKVQRGGSFLSEMIMPNIGAFVAWGIIAALFIEKGWFPNATIAEMVSPMLRWLLPMLVAYTAGYNIYKQKGGVIASIAGIGAVMASETPMFLAIMIIAPLSAYIYKKIDLFMDGKIKPGFEMLVNSAVIGVLGAIISIIAFLVVGPLLEGVSNAFMIAVDYLTSRGLFPLISIIAEPAKVLFLNNALFHGVLMPIGMNQIASEGYTVLYWAIANIGPGLGVLLAYMFFGTGASKQSSPGAIIIHTLGGIHEMYFPFVLKNPLHLISIIVSGSVGLFLFNLFNVGLVAPPALGSIFAILAVTQRSSIIPAILVMLVSTLVSFAISAVVVKLEKPETVEKVDSTEEEQNETNNIDYFFNGNDIKNIVFACDAGQGSSAMGAALLNKKIKENDIEGVTVKNYAISNIPENADLIVTHKDLANRAKRVKPDGIYVLVDNFLAPDKYDEVVEILLKNKQEK